MPRFYESLCALFCESLTSSNSTFITLELQIHYVRSCSIRVLLSLNNLASVAAIAFDFPTDLNLKY